MGLEMSLITPHTHTHTHTRTRGLTQNFKLLGNGNQAVAKVQGTTDKGTTSVYL